MYTHTHMYVHMYIYTYVYECTGLEIRLDNQIQ